MTMLGDLRPRHWATASPRCPRFHNNLSPRFPCGPPGGKKSVGDIIQRSRLNLPTKCRNMWEISAIMVVRSLENILPTAHRPLKYLEKQHSDSFGQMRTIQLCLEQFGTNLSRDRKNLNIGQRVVQRWLKAQREALLCDRNSIILRWSANLKEINWLYSRISRK